jgi:hypothetical protein
MPAAKIEDLRWLMVVYKRVVEEAPQKAIAAHCHRVLGFESMIGGRNRFFIFFRPFNLSKIELTRKGGVWCTPGSWVGQNTDCVTRFSRNISSRLRPTRPLALAAKEPFQFNWTLSH